MMTKTIEVEVFGQRFSLQGEGDEAYFHELAEYVDAQMRTLAKQIKNKYPHQTGYFNGHQSDR